MPKPRTLERRAQRKRAAARLAQLALLSPEQRMQSDKFNELLKDIYRPALTAMFTDENPFYRRLRGEDDAFAVGKTFTIPLHGV